MKKITLLFTFLISTFSFGQIIITELADPNNSNNTANPQNTRYVEIYNVSGAGVDLTNWELRRWTNGTATPQGSGIDLTSIGTLASGGFAIIAANSTDFQAAYGFAPDINGGGGGAADSNGDDQIAIFDASDATIDIFGVPGEDGSGTCHEFEDGRAERVASVTASASTFNEAEWNVWADSSVSGCTNHTQAAQDTPGIFDPGSWIGASSDPSLTASTSMSVFTPGTTSVDITFAANNFTLGGANVVEYVVNSGAAQTTTSSPIAISVADGQSYTVTLELKDAGGSLTPQVLETVNFSVASLTNVANIAALRGSTEGQFYTLTGEAVLTFQQSFRNQKFIEDNTGAILIDDDGGAFTTAYNVADGITGITGELTSFNGLLQFVPSSDPGAASSTGNAIDPQLVTLAQLTATPENYESELVAVADVTVDNSGNATWVNGAEYALTQNTDNFNFRATFFDVDYIGQNVPTTAVNIVGIITERNNGSYFITARDSNDFPAVLSVADFNSETQTFSIYPNPVYDGFINFSSTFNGDKEIRIFNILGTQVLAKKLDSTSLNVSNLSTGVYLVQLFSDGVKVDTQKLIIR
ncbi:T9SS type A sorting domain-containing protein [Aquimarina sp. 2201CG5-10]|uniref:T9SS type A sorting domain-containing protein n=1 Tax=Aquimarina callyspongiae TaxID=3098150 RepID=UPI002AB49858|nr:T9SS type A sorting domain-containing protein [Aquimarina sp. 2201CG5-10]MDY8134973.1 T9SS type A sorting domain-containing protein [Aquimarina sp. 2201CG5-10]